MNHFWKQKVIIPALHLKFLGFFFFLTLFKVGAA